jgi:hypothetical protein
MRRSAKVANARTTTTPNPGNLLKFLDSSIGFAASHGGGRAISAPGYGVHGDPARLGTKKSTRICAAQGLVVQGENESLYVDMRCFIDPIVQSLIIPDILGFDASYGSRDAAIKCARAYACWYYYYAGMHMCFGHPLRTMR